MIGEPETHPAGLRVPPQEQARPATTAQQHLNRPFVRWAGLGGILLLFLSLAIWHSIVVPISQGEDELAHYRYIKFIAQTGRLPVNHLERKTAWYRADWPPLYHLLVGWAVSPLDTTRPHLKDVGESPHRRLVGQIFYPRLIIYTEDARWPWQDGILAWHIGRFISILFSAGALVFTYLTALELGRGAEEQGSRGAGERRSIILPSPYLPASPSSSLPISPHLLALPVTALLAFTPRFVFTSAMLGDDSLFILLSAIFIWLLLRALRGDDRWWLYGLMGLLLGLSITTKYSTGLLPLAVAPVAWWRARQKGWPWPQWAERVALSWLGTLLGASWWFGWIGYYFNTIEEDGLLAGLLNGLLNTGPDVSMRRIFAFFTGEEFSGQPRPDAIAPGTFSEWWTYLFQTFWGVPVLERDPFFPWAYILIAIICLLALVGLASLWRSATAQARITLGVLLLIVGLLFPFPILRFFLTYNVLETGQGRHILYPAAQAIPILLVLGLIALVGRVGEAKRRTTDDGRRTTNDERRTTNDAPRLTHHSSLVTRHSSLLLSLLPLILLIWSIFQLVYMARTYPEPLPVQTTTFDPGAIPQPLEQRFHEGIKLLGYGLEPVGEEGVANLTLFWQATGPVDENYRVRVQLIDLQGDSQLTWLSHPLNGDYPTRAWDEGDIIRDTMPLPLSGLAAGNYHLELNLLREAELTPLQAEPLLVTRLNLEESVPPVEPVTSGPYTYRLWSGDQPARYRQTIALTWFESPETLDGTLADNPKSEIKNPKLTLLGPDNTPREPLVSDGHTAIFIVGADWPSGDYHLQLPGREEPVQTTSLLTVANEPRLFELPPVPESYVPVEANFADQVKLLGYSLPARRVEPGGGLPVTLYWQSLAPVLGDYIVFDVLLNEARQVYGGYDRLPREYYSTILWAEGEVVEDGFAVPVRPEAPPGIYHLHVGLYSLKTGSPVSLPLVQAGQPAGATSVVIGPLKAGGPPPEVVTDDPTPQVTLSQSFGGQITLLGYDLTGDAGQPISNLHLTLYWRADTTPAADYTTFVHLRDQTGNNVAQKDSPPANGRYPTSLWDPGEIIVDNITLPLADLPPGDYNLVAGLYNFATGERLPTEGLPANELRLESVTLP